MPITIAAGALSVINLEFINGVLRTAELPPLDAIPAALAFINYGDILRFKSDFAQSILVVLHETARHGVIEGQQFNVATLTYPRNSYVYFLNTVIESPETTHRGMIIAVGPLSHCATVRDILQQIHANVAVLGNVENIHRVVPPLGITDFMTLGMDQPYCLLASEEQLFTILEDTNHTQSTRIMTALAAMFPYIIPELGRKVALIGSYPAENVQTPVRGIGGLGQGTPEDGRRLTLLAVYLLGPAYSRKEKLHEQIARRAQAACVADKVQHLTAERTKDLLETIHWEPANIDPIVDDVLGMVVCRTSTDTTDPDSPIAGLRSPAELEGRDGISHVAAILLEQARLVYINYHSSSLHFIVPIFDQLVQTVGEANQTFARDIQHFRSIRQVVETAPYMGLRSQIPDRYQIRNNAKLAYLGVVCHRESLTTEEEKASFKEYKISAIREHIPNLNEAASIDSLAKVMPARSISALASLVAELPLDKAQSLMASKSPEVKAEVLDILRHKPTKGGWAEDCVVIENAEYLQSLIDAGLVMLRKALDEQYEIRRATIDTIDDQAERQRQRRALVEWKAGILAGFDTLSSWEDTLPKASRGGQNLIRENTLAKLKRFMNTIKGQEPMDQTPPPEPTQPQ
ncbi:MAG: hypothetical protein [Bat faecal associated arto-like virus 2]|nr:MAG: hypothetical protein [Bat faecal associated arto-like virus 2]